MRKLRVVLFAAFLIGVLLAGVGAGLTMVEWSSLEYGGTKLLDSEYLVTEDFDFTLKDDGSTLILGESYYTNRYLDGIVEDSSVPEGIVRYQVTYNQALVDPFLQYIPYDREEETGEEIVPEAPEERAPVIDGILRLMRSYHGDEFRLFMENKDEMLSDLKKGRLSNYEVADITDVKILVNPATRPRVEERAGW